LIESTFGNWTNEITLKIMARGKQLFQLTREGDGNHGLEPLIGCAARPALKFFMSTFLPCLAYEETELYSTDKNFVSAGIMEAANFKCEGCTNEAVLRDSMARSSVDFPTRDAFEKWKEWIIQTPKSAMEKSYWLLEQLTMPLFPLEVNANTYASIWEYLASCGFVKPRSVPSQFDKLCYWDLGAVATMVNLVDHCARHKPSYDSNDTLLCRTSYSWLSNSILADSPILMDLPTKARTVICVAFMDTHYAVLEIKRDSRQVVVYDGMDGTPDLISKLPKSRKDCSVLPAPDGVNEAADRYWKEYVFYLLRCFSLIGNNIDDLLAGSDNRSIVRAANSKCGDGDLWQIVTPPVLYTADWKQRLICQFDLYSCGRIALLHVMKLLGYPIQINYAKREATARPDPSVLINDNIVDWRQLIGEYWRDAVGSKSLHGYEVVDQEFWGFYVGYLGMTANKDGEESNKTNVNDHGACNNDNDHGARNNDKPPPNKSATSTSEGESMQLNFVSFVSEIGTHDRQHGNAS
jgi:hypothetical protein